MPLRRTLGEADPLPAWSAVILPLALWGVARTLRGARRWFQSLPLLAVLYFSALSAVFWGALRMRVPVEPLVTLFAAAGFEDLRQRLRVRRRGLRVVGTRD